LPLADLSELWTPRISEKGLFALSLISISLLLLASDHGAPLIQDFGALEGAAGEVEVICLVTDVRATDKGWMLDLTDTRSQTMSGYCSKAVMTCPPPAGTVLRIRGRLSDDPEPLFCIEGVSALTEKGKV